MHGKVLTIVILGSLLVSTQIFAQDDVISKRKALMSQNSKDAKAIADAAKEKDYATIETKAKEIVGNLDAVVKLFPEGSTSEKSRAHPDIWVKNDEFKNKAANARKAAEALSKAAASKNEAEVNIKVKELGNPREGACGDCHKLFRTDFRKDS
ncbi:MAG TPA: cytochrome c [Candidatus Binatia bacterium]|nr:cytochrome c [Candidatus Binatia bacterium]